MSSKCQSPNSVDVYLLTENRLLREILARDLHKRTAISVVGAGPDVESATPEIASTHPEILLTDLLANSDHASCLDDLIEQFPHLKVVLFGMHEDAEQFLHAVYLGISGYLLKEATSAEIASAVRAVAQGEAACSPRLCFVLLRHVAQQARTRAYAWAAAREKCPLTYRQLQLVELVAKGMSNKEIASALNLSEHTVKNHIHRIMRQMNADDRHQIVDFVRAAGTVPSLMPQPIAT